MKLVIPKRGIWKGCTIDKIGKGKRAYFWIGEGDKYLLTLTTAQARRVAKFLSSK